MQGRTTAPSRVLVIIPTIVTAIVLLFASSVGAASELASVETDTYRVRGGDSLWAIATDYTPAGGDVRATIAAIKRINGLETSIIVPGQVLEVPLTD